MKTSLRHQFFARLKPISVLQFAGLSLLAIASMFVTAGSGQAQTQSAAAKAAPANVPAAPQTPAQQSAVRQPPKGLSTGIKVHGHWVIEVKNLDGSLAMHREFENGLASGGATLLASLLGGVVTPGSWYVALESQGSSVGALLLVQPNSAAGNPAAAVCASYIAGGNPCSVSTTLAVVAPINNPPGTLSGTTVTFSGQIPVPPGFPSSINYVETDSAPCVPSDSPQTCFDDTTNGNYFALALTSRNLDGQGSDPQPVSVSPGQTVSVNVVISFASGS